MFCRFMYGAVLLVVGSCATSSLAGSEPLVGEWGGVHAGLTLTNSGGTIAYDCAGGTISVPVVPDRAGDFLVVGKHVRGHGGPVRIGEVADSLPARYAGHVSRGDLRLTVFVGADTLGPFALQLGAAPQIFRCL